MQTVYLLVTTGQGEKKRTFWNRAGVVFDSNKDNSHNMKMDMFPSLTFQIRKQEDPREVPDNA